MPETSELLAIEDSRRQATFSLSNRLRRVFWSVAYTFLFRPTPRPMHAWRAAILRAFGAEVGRGTHVYAKVEIWAPWNLTVDDEAGIADGVRLYSMGKIHVGRRAVVSQGAHLCAGTHDYRDPAFRLIARPITIGAEAWICADAFVGPGVTIGEGAVLGARGVASRDIPPWTVWAGNPAQMLKERTMREATAGASQA